MFAVPAYVLKLAVLFADTGHFVHDIVNVKNHFHHANLLIVNGGIKLRLDFRLAHVVNPESQLDSCQRTGVSRVTIGDRLSSQAGSFALRCAQQNDDVLGAILFGEFLDPLLILQIHCTGGRSDEAFR